LEWKAAEKKGKSVKHTKAHLVDNQNRAICNSYTLDSKTLIHPSRIKKCKTCLKKGK
jgi:hypothetical protein